MGRVIVESLRGCGDGIINCAIKACGVSLSEIVCLCMSIVSSHKFPIYLVQIVALQDNTRDDTLSRGSLHVHLNNTEHDIEFRLDRG
jgi:hypothetical protein